MVNRTDEDKEADFQRWYNSEKRSPEALNGAGWRSEYKDEVDMGIWYPFEPQ